MSVREISLWSKCTHKKNILLFHGIVSAAAHRTQRQLQHKTLCLCLCFTGACNPSGNKQKRSVRTNEPEGRESRLLWLDMLMLAGVPVTESCKRSSKTRWLVSHESEPREPVMNMSRAVLHKASLYPSALYLPDLFGVAGWFTGLSILDFMQNLPSSLKYLTTS